MSRTRGKREAAKSGWQTGGDPFQEEQAPKRVRKSGKKGRGVKILLIVLAVIAALPVIVVGTWRILVKPPEVQDKQRPAVTDKTNKPTEDGQKPGVGGENAQPVSGRKDDYFTFLLLGKDTSSGSTDTIILVSYDVKAGEVNFMSIPRDTMVNIPKDMKRINSIYSSKAGIDGLKEHVGYLTGVTPDNYVVVEWKAVGRIVKALGGVWFDVPFNMNYDDPYQDLHIHQEKGYRLLDGDDAMQVVRWRKNNDGTNYGDTTRVDTQQAFLKAVAKQCLQLGNVTKVKEFAEVFAENIKTDLTISNILWLAEHAMGLDMEKIQFMTLPGEHNGFAWSRTYKNNQSYVFADPAQVVEMVNAYFNPYNEDITEDDLQIMYKNKDGSLGVTNGTLEDTAAASAPVKPPKPPKQDKPKDTETEEPKPPEESGEATDPGKGDGDTTVPDGGENNTTGSGGQTTPEPEPEPELPPEPTLPPEEGTGEPTAPADGGNVDDEAPGWL